MKFKYAVIRIEGPENHWGELEGVFNTHEGAKEWIDGNLMEDAKCLWCIYVLVDTFKMEIKREQYVV